MTVYQPETALYAAAGASTVGSVILMNFDSGPGIQGFSLHQYCGTTISGAWKIEITNDPRALPGHKDNASAVWDDETVAFALTAPTAAAIVNEIKQYEGKFYAMRATWTSVAGVTPIYLWLMR